MSTLGALPLPVRVGLRDSFDSPNSAVQKSLKSLNDVVGYDITLEIAWVDIWNDLQSQFSADKTTFVPTITDAIATWLKRTEDLLESSEEFQEAFMDKMDRLRKALFIQIHDEALPKTQLVRGELLTLFLPKAGPPEYRSFSSRIGSDIEQVFSGKAAATSHAALNPEAANDDFVDVAPSREAPKATRVKSLPTLSTIPRPDNLFTSLLPYTVIVRRTGGGIDIESSHQPTLELISEYFKRHARKNLNDTRQIPYFKIELVASSWGSGTYHDVCRITKEDTRASWIQAEITPILAFVEGVCGYDLYKTDGEWIFRRTEPFV